jgi:oligopeptide transport system substrate-binding protein
MNIGYHSDVNSLDPVQTPNICVPDPVVDNVFDGLYRIDSHLLEVPDLAAGMPDVSSDQKTYKFHLRRGVRSNGDAFKAQDVAYSWNRSAVAYAKGGGTGDFWPVDGYSDVAAGKTATLRGISLTDAYSLTVNLSHPAAHWLAALALALYDVVDQRAIEARGDSWWQTADGLVGTGPFRMTGRDPGHSLDFEPVPNWWGGSTGALRHVHVVIRDDLAQEFRSGHIDYIGAQSSGCERDFSRKLVLRFLSDTGRGAAAVHFGPPTGTFFVRFGAGGPLAGVDAKPGRIALSQAIDRQQLVRKTYITAVAATGGPIASGLRGYLGGNADSNARFDRAAARATYHEWDPDGSKARSISYVYNFSDLNDAVAHELQAQWRDNLGIEVELKPVDGPTFFAITSENKYALARLGWSADYDDPQDWFNNTDLNLVTPDETALLDLARLADSQSPTTSLATYRDANRRFVADAVAISLAYGGKPYIVKPYVRGAGETGFSEFPWTGVSILAH